MGLYLWAYGLNTYTRGVQKARLQLQVTSVSTQFVGILKET